MTKFILIRHGETSYNEVKNLGFKGHGLALSPLNSNGIKEIETLSKNKIFENSDILISSPYTRAMQTASIIGNKYNLKVNVELLLHEWLPDLTYEYNDELVFFKNYKIAFKEYKMKQEGKNFTYNDKIESLENLKTRAINTLRKYYGYNKVIVVTHSLLIHLLFNEQIKLHTGEYVVITDEELENNFKQKTLKK